MTIGPLLAVGQPSHTTQLCPPLAITIASWGFTVLLGGTLCNTPDESMLEVWILNRTTLEPKRLRGKPLYFLSVSADIKGIFLYFQ